MSAVGLSLMILATAQGEIIKGVLGVTGAEMK
jgi:hypothetical protein